MEPRPRPARKAIPIRVKLEACLILLGFDPEKIKKRLPDFNHFPALGRRTVNEAGTDYDPPQLDPRYLGPVTDEQHLRFTTGRKGESKYSSDGNGDTTQAAKGKRLEADQIAFRARMLAKEPGRQGLRKDTIKSRGFKKGVKVKLPSKKHPFTRILRQS